MSIFKETFPKFVRDQLAQREEIIASGAGSDGNGAFNFKQNKRSEEFYTYTLNKQCVLRMSSAVDIIDEKIFSEDTGKGVSVAENWVLEGGIKSKGSNRGGFTNGKNTNTAYGDKNIRSNAADGYGIVPMPGITSATVRTKSAYGSLREAKVDFVCHNRRQLEVLELLYMRPGYTLMLEWGWDPYINNEGEQDSWSFIDGFFDTQTKTKQLERTILKKKEDTGGNYDALLGYCKNFTYSLRDDGGFNCTTEIIAKGEILSSLKDIDTLVNVDDTIQTRPNLELIFQQLVNFSDDVGYGAPIGLIAPEGPIGADLFGQAKRRREEKLPLIMESLKLDSSILYNEKGEYEEVNSAKEEVDVGLKGGDTNYYNENALKPWIIADGPRGYQKSINYDWHIGRQAVFDNPGSESDGKFGNARDHRTTTTWIRWDALAFLITDNVIPKDEDGEPLVEIQTNRIANEHTNNPLIEPLQYTNHTPQKLPFYLPTITKDQTVSSMDWNITDISTNNQICMLPHNLYDHAALHPETVIYDTLFPPMAENMAKHVMEGKSVEIDRKLTLPEQKFNIGGIYLGVEWMLSLYKSMYYDENGNVNNDYSLYDFLSELWKGVNKTTGNNHEFILNNEGRPDGKIVRIIDLQAESATLDLEKVHELKIQSLDSTVRDIVYNTTIPSSLSSTIAIAAQAPDSVDNLDQVSFAALNRGIRDRFATVEINNIEGYFGGDANEETEQKTKWNLRFDQNLLAIYEAIYIFDQESFKNVLGSISNNYSWWTKTGAAAIAGYSGAGAALVGGYVAWEYWKTVNTNFGGTLRDLLYHQYTVNSNRYLKEEGGGAQTEDIAKFKGSLKGLRKAIEYFSRVYGSQDTESKIPKYFRGQPYNGASRSTSSIIPLKFNAKMDGISGLVMGNVFKLPKNRLPMAYNGDDIHFIVMGEEQSISPGQDWTTTITGQITLLGGKSNESEDFIKSWKNPESAISAESIENMDIESYDDGKDFQYNNSFGDYIDMNFEKQSLSDPLERMSITSPYGKRDLDKDPKTAKTMHRGIDLSTEGQREPIYAVWDGVISWNPVGGATKKQPKGNCGGMIILSFIPMDYGDGRKGYPVANERGRSQVQPRMAKYCHIHELSVKEGATVRKGQKIGMSGGHGTLDDNPGNSNDRHLHFALLNGSNHIPPAPWLPDDDTWWQNTQQWFAQLNENPYSSETTVNR